MDTSSNGHILQQTGLLKNFSVAKIINADELRDLKTLIRAVSESESEYKKMLDEELARIGNMHDPKNPVPGLIYSKNENKIQKIILEIAKKFSAATKKQKFDKRALAFLVTAIINNLELTQEDFKNLRDELEDEENESNEDSDD